MILLCSIHATMPLRSRDLRRCPMGFAALNPSYSDYNDGTLNGALMSSGSGAANVLSVIDTIA
jgi:hypothetical protein